MIKYIYTYDGSKLVRTEEGSPVQGVDSCSACGEDLYLMGGQPCPVSITGHKWVQLGDN